MNQASYSSNMASGSSTPDTTIGFTRSRTLLFLSYRDSVVRDNPNYASYRDDDDDDDDEYSTIKDEYSTSKGKSKAKSKGKAKSRTGTYYNSSGDLDSNDNQDDRNPLLNSQGDDYSYPPQGQSHSSVDMTSLPPKWMDTSDEIDAILNALKPKISTLDKLHSKHVLPGFTDRSREEREIEEMTREITSVSTLSWKKWGEIG